MFILTSTYKDWCVLFQLHLSIPSCWPMWHFYRINNTLALRYQLHQQPRNQNVYQLESRNTKKIHEGLVKSFDDSSPMSYCHYINSNQKLANTIWKFFALALVNFSVGRPRKLERVNHPYWWCQSLRFMPNWDLSFL